MRKQHTRLQRLVSLLGVCLLLSACSTATPGEALATGTNPENTNNTAAPTATNTETVTQTPQATALPTPAIVTEAPVTATNAPTAAPTQKPTSSPTAAPTATPRAYAMTTEQLVTPFWETDTMYCETTCFVQEGGKITAKLLFKPTEIISLRDWTLQKEYKQGTDWVWDGTSKTLTLPEGSAIGYFTPAELAGSGAPAYPTWDDEGRTRLGNALYCVSEFLYGRQLAITYKYKKADFSYTPAGYQGSLLPKTMQKLQAGQPITVVAYGDSILSGSDASSLYNRAPKMPTFFNLFTKGLRDRYGSTVTSYNRSVGGWTSQQGVDNFASKMSGIHNIDLFILGFGQNDSAYTAAQTVAHLQTIMDAVRADNPNCEFLVLTTLRANDAAGFVHRQPEYPAAFAPLTGAGKGAALVDIYSMHAYLLQSKRFVDLTGNNINHPNDFFIRIHAMLLLSTMIAY